MKKVININFQGRILPIEEMAYENLKNYIESLSAYFEKEEGKDEIINDIECRVAELCEDRLKKGAVCITEDDINLIIESIGRPADFEAQDGFEAQSSSGNSNYSSSQNEGQNNWDNIRPKRLYRDEQNKVLGGVCSGIANYFGLEPLLVRILWIFLIGVNILGYLILWIAVPSSSVKEIGGVKKRLFRDIENKVIGGVCAGLSKYFGIKVWIIRILFLIPFIRLVFNFREIHLFQFWDAPDFPNFLDITFSPGSVFIYIVLWLVLPEAKTSADKLEMVGEKVDLNSIKNTIQNDMEGFSKRAQGWGSDLKNKYQTDHASNTKNGASAHPSEKRKGIVYYIGRIITISIKAFVYFILGIIGISLLAALFGIGVAATAVMPLRKFLLEDGAQIWSVYGALLFFVWVPIIGIVTAVVRKLAGYKKANVWVRSSFVALWVVGWVLLFYFGSSLGHSFSKHNVPEEQTVALANPAVDYLEVTASPKMKYYEDRWFQISPFDAFSDEDTVFVRNLRIRIVQSKTDSFQVKVVKLSNGKTIQNANELASKINFDLTQQDSLVFLDRGIAINKKDKFRNQHIIMTIAVPLGKRIKITNKGWSQTNVRINGRGMHTETFDRISSDDDWYDEWNEPWDNESFSYERGVEYKMTATGLEKIKRDDDAEEKLNNDDQDPDEMEQRLEELKREREEIENNLEKNREEKLRELEKIDKALEKQKKDINKSTQKISASVDASDVKKSRLPKVAGKLTDINWVLERFTY
ncbi:MAG: PspC domain-containing protein [Sediminibacterium sp.]|jgi:phage shock protein PspC (stress-responsive transcriptional regulator)|nr:PspC domain-containing protein [Sediminibacterium sp.]